MNTGKYVFAQVCALLPFNDFIKCVDKYEGNYYVKHFTCWNQLMCMLFGQFCNRQSLSDLVICLQSQKNKWYHLGMGLGVSKSNLAYANEHRPWEIFSEFADILIRQARNICVNSKDLEVKVDGQVYAVDSTTIKLCFSLFEWARFRTNESAIKLHTQFDIRSEIPKYLQFSDGATHDVNILDSIEFEKGAFYVMDRAYISFARLSKINQAEAFFVTRAQDNQKLKRLYSAAVDKSTGVLCDQVVKLVHFRPLKKYPSKFRRIKYFDSDTNVTFDFMTNNFALPALDIARLYKYRWSVELFFKWIKQHLKIKSFWGYNENAVRIQIYTAIIAYTAVAILKEQFKIKHSIYEILQILSITLVNKTQINQLFDKSYQQNFKELDDNQLIIF